MMLVGMGLLIGHAQQQVTNAEIIVSVRSGGTVDARVLERVKRNELTGSILGALTTGVPTRPQHWTNFSTDSTGAYSYSSNDASPSPLLLRTLTPKFIAPAALPFAAGLGVVVGALFIAATRWRPNV